MFSSLLGEDVVAFLGVVITCYICLCVAGGWTTPKCDPKITLHYYHCITIKRPLAKGTAGAGCCCSKSLSAQQENTGGFLVTCSRNPQGLYYSVLAGLVPELGLLSGHWHMVPP